MQSVSPAAGKADVADTPTTTSNPTIMSEEEASDVLVADTPQELPQCYRCKLEKFYIRDCYPDYYDYVVESMEEGKCYIVVTGTPGIGKSVFYLYFFEKYKARCDKKIVVASYSKTRKLKECKIWDPDSRELETSDVLPTKLNGALYLIDGIPDTEPLDSNFTIMFASPDIKFFISMNKHGSQYSEIYMPNWTHKEIMDAIDALRLTISQEVINDRWNYFGGAPRYLFEPDKNVVQRATINVATAVNTLHSVEDVLACFNGSADPEVVLHRLMQYDVQDMRGVFDRRLKMASNHIAYLVQEKFNKKLRVDQQSLMCWLSGSSKSAAFLGWLFEGYAHEKLQEGSNLPLKRLNAQATADSIKIAKTIGEYTKFRMAKLEQIFEEAYRQPKSDTLRSVDSYFLTATGVLWLFQMTRNINHQINVEGLLELLETLGKLQDTQNVNLVFVVPKDVGSTFPVQTFKQLEVFGPELSEEQMRELDVDKIPKIAGYKKRKLNDDGITKIGELLDVKNTDPSRVSLVRSALAEFETNRQRHQHQQAILNLKQYCMELDYTLPDITKLHPFF